MAALQRRRLSLRPSLFAQIVGLGVLSVALTIAYFALISLRLEYSAEEERFGLALDRIAATAALSIDGDAHRRIRSNADANGPEFSPDSQLPRARPRRQLSALRPDLHLPSGQR